MIPSRVQRVITQASAEAGLSPEIVMSKTRVQACVDARYAAFRQIRTLERAPSFSAIARWTGFDRTTIMYAVKGRKR